MPKAKKRSRVEGKEEDEDVEGTAGLVTSITTSATPAHPMHSHELAMLMDALQNAGMEGAVIETKDGERFTVGGSQARPPVPSIPGLCANLVDAILGFLPATALLTLSSASHAFRRLLNVRVDPGSSSHLGHSVSTLKISRMWEAALHREFPCWHSMLPYSFCLRRMSATRVCTALQDMTAANIYDAGLVRKPSSWCVEISC